MKIAILNFEQPWHVLASTSLIRGLKHAYPSASISFFVSQESFPIIQFNKSVEAISGYISPNIEKFDLAINMSPSLEACNFMTEIPSVDKKGFTEKLGSVTSLNADADEYFSIMHNGNKSERHALQVIFRLCGMTWKGEGYDLAYFPKNKTNRKKTGIAISHDPLRTFVKNNLKLEMTDIWHVPMKKNLFKRMDEINRCMYILTDDLFTLHASIALRKNVEFLDVIGLNTRLEFFGRGNYYRISDGDWRVQMEKDGVEENLRSTEEACDV